MGYQTYETLIANGKEFSTANLFNFFEFSAAIDPEKNVKDSAESVMREVIGKTNIDFALAEGRDQVRQEAQESLQKILDRNESGITVSSLLLQKSDPPPAVIDDFKDFCLDPAANENFTIRQNHCNSNSISYSLEQGV